MTDLWGQTARGAPAGEMVVTTTPTAKGRRPDHWLNPTGALPPPTLKIADYTATGRLVAPLDPDEAPGYLSAPLPETLPHADGIAAARHSFPAALRAN